jgi:hypothetical protein
MPRGTAGQIPALYCIPASLTPEGRVHQLSKGRLLSQSHPGIGRGRRSERKRAVEKAHPGTMDGLADLAEERGERSGIGQGFLVLKMLGWRGQEVRTTLLMLAIRRWRV